MRKIVTGLAMLVLLGVFPGSGLAQQPNPGPEAERMAQMMKMMEQMHEQMMGQMQGQMKQMREQMMGQMGSMMHQHRAEMQKACHGAAAPAEPK